MRLEPCPHPIRHVDQCISIAFNPDRTHKVLQVCAACGARRWLTGAADVPWILPWRSVGHAS